MHPLHEYLAQHQDKALQQDRVVVFYDARSEFEPCLTELEVVGTGIADLPPQCQLNPLSRKIF